MSATVTAAEMAADAALVRRLLAPAPDGSLALFTANTMDDASRRAAFRGVHIIDRGFGMPDASSIERALLVGAIFSSMEQVQ